MKLKLPQNDIRSLWIKLAIVAVLIRIFFGFFPQLCEVIYSRGIYLLIRLFFDNTIGYLPFAGVYIFISLFTIWVLKKLVTLIIDIKKKESLKDKKIGFSFLSFIAAVIFWFLLLWGYNYARLPINLQMSFEIPESLNFEEIWEEAQFIKEKCISARNSISGADTNALDASFYPVNLEEKMRSGLKKVLKKYGYDYSSNVRGRFLVPDGILHRFNSSGVYFPFTGEGHIDNALHPSMKPFTMAHELAHGYGFGSEAECNFLGYLTCIESDVPAIRYSGYLMYWRYVYGALMEFMTEEDYLLERATISRGMYNDLEDIYNTADRFPPFLPFLQPAVYDIFLKVQGVEDGIESYDRMVLLVSSWRK